MKKTTTFALGSATALAASTHSDAAIVYFDVNPAQTIGAAQAVIFGEINLSQGTYNLGDTDGVAFSLQFDGPGTSLYNGMGGGFVQWGMVAPGYVFKLSYGSTINPGTAPSWGSSYDYLARLSNGYWAGGANAYAPLRINQGSGNYNYGWVAINYDTLGPTATITGFAFEDQINTAILAGDQGSPSAVPEPGQVASSILLLAGIAGYFAYRRRMGAATEPDALHKLALGARGIADFRADKAA